MLRYYNVYKRVTLVCLHDLPEFHQNFVVAKDCTPEIDTSEIIVDCQWHFPMDCQWCVPTNLHFSAVVSQGIVTFPVDVHWIVPMDSQWHVPMDSQWHFPMKISLV